MKKSSTRRVAGAALAVLAAGLAPIAAPTPAWSAEPGCWASGCDDKGPVSNNCDDTASRTAVTSIALPASGGADRGVAELFFSSGCHSAWVRGNSARTGANPVSADYTVRVVKARRSDGVVVFRDSVVIPDNMDGPLGEYYDWTNMAGYTATTKIRACAGHNGEWACTAWYQLG